MDAKPVSFFLATALHAPLIYGVYSGMQKTATTEMPSIAVEILSIQTTPKKMHEKAFRKKVRRQQNTPKSQTETLSPAAKPALMPLVLRTVKPIYPREARRQGLEGIVKVSAQITEQGLPSNIKIVQSCGHQVLDRAAVVAFEQWRFQKQIAKQEVIAPVVFRLKP